MELIRQMFNAPPCNHPTFWHHRFCAMARVNPQPKGLTGGALRSRGHHHRPHKPDRANRRQPLGFRERIVEPGVSSSRRRQLIRGVGCIVTRCSVPQRMLRQSWVVFRPKRQNWRPVAIRICHFRPLKPPIPCARVLCHL